MNRFMDSVAYLRLFKDLKIVDEADQTYEGKDMSDITVKMFPAENGDCFLVSLGNKVKKHILIDCGYANTYDNFLKDELRTIANNNEIIDLMVISHVDQDHILGAITFLEDNNTNPFIKINEIWHNSYRHLQFNKKKDKSITEHEKEILIREILLGSSFLYRKMNNNKNQAISAKQGSSLASLILEGQYHWNESFNSKAVNIDNTTIIQKNDYIIHLLSPNTEKLNKLSNRWLKELRMMKLSFSLSDEAIFDDAYEFSMVKQEETNVEVMDISLKTEENDHRTIDEVIKIKKEKKDDTVMNGSSISFVIEYNEKQLLFLADSHPDIIIEGLSNLKNKDFDLIKISHHGSKKNTTHELAKILNSDLFLISTNGKGKHQHPDFESIAKIIYHQKNHKTLIFNYETSTAKKVDNTLWKKIYNYNICISDGSSPTKIEI